MLLKKLRVRPEVPLIILRLPEECQSLFDDGTYTTTRPHNGLIEQLILFAKNTDVLTEIFIGLVEQFGRDPLIWVIYPRKSGSIKSDLSMVDGWKPVLNAGFATVASAAVNDDWTALRFRRKMLVKSPVAREVERSNEYIDYAARTVSLPDDATRALQNIPGLKAFFDGLAFTHRKEHVLAITEAKKPETRQRRIVKMTETVNRAMETKAAKKR